MRINSSAANLNVERNGEMARTHYTLLAYLSSTAAAADVIDTAPSKDAVVIDTETAAAATGVVAENISRLTCG